MSPLLLNFAASLAMTLPETQWQRAKDSDSRATYSLLKHQSPIVLYPVDKFLGLLTLENSGKRQQIVNTGSRSGAKLCLTLKECRPPCI